MDADPEAEERRLVAGLLAREPAALDEFLNRTHHPLYCMACRFTRDPDLRRDWTHSVLLAILDDLERDRFHYRHPGSFWAWFRKRAHYRLLDEYRRHRLRLEREGSEEPGEWAGTAGVDNPADEFERAELLSAVEACLDRLPNPDQRRALGLLLLEDLSYEQIAESLSAPLNTVRAWIRRGRIAVRECLGARLGPRDRALKP